MSTMTPADFETCASLLVNGEGAPRSREQLISEVKNALYFAYEDGSKSGRAEASSAPKLGAVYALEGVREKIDSTINQLRKDIG